MDHLDLAAGLRRFFDAENAYYRADPATRDIQSMLKELDPDVVVEVPSSLPHGGTWLGRRGFADLVAAVGRHWSEFEVVCDQDQWHPVDDRRVLVEGVLRGALRSTGNRVEMPFVWLFTFTSRGAARLVHYYQDTAAIVAAAQSS